MKVTETFLVLHEEQIMGSKYRTICKVFKCGNIMPRFFMEQHGKSPSLKEISQAELLEMEKALLDTKPPE